MSKRRSISTFTLLFTSVSAILGSGWLFTNYYTAALAGPAAIISWLLGGAAIIFIAFVFAELCAMLPLTGSSTRIPQYTHGTLVNFLFAWIIWLSYAALAPTEVQAVIQYLHYFFPVLLNPDSSLSLQGYELAIVLMLVVSAINIFSLRWLLRCNNLLTVMKIAIPLILGFFILWRFFSFRQMIYPADSVFLPYGWHGVLAALATGGVVFAFNGFKQACELAGEARNPHRSLPIAIIGSILICLLIYVILQLAFYASITPDNLKISWHQLFLPGKSSPLAALLKQDNLTVLLPLLYVGAIVGPLAAALMYGSSASRALYGMSKNNHVPLIFSQLTTQGNPLYAIILNFILGVLMFAPLPGWDKMVTFLTSLMAVTYVISPVCLLALRQQMPQQHRPLRLPAASAWATFAFYLCTLLIYWSGWQTISKLAIALLLGLGVLFIHRAFLPDKKSLPLHFSASVWVWPYFAGISLISYLGNFSGGLAVIPFGWDFAVIAIFCILIMWLAMKFKLPAEVTRDYIHRLEMRLTS